MDKKVIKVSFVDSMDIIENMELFSYGKSLISFYYNEEVVDVENVGVAFVVRRN